MSVYVCVRARLSVCDHIFGTTRPIFTEFFYTCYLWPVLLWRRSGVLRRPISGFMDDVIFVHKQRLLDVAAQLKHSAHAALKAWL